LMGVMLKKDLASPTLYTEPDQISNFTEQSSFCNKKFQKVD